MSKQKTEESEVADYNFLKKAVTIEGFIGLYFDALPKFETCVDAFDELNERYLSITGEYRFSSYHSFRSSLAYNRKK
ncbi:hypothetical protein Phi39:1_gp08 [Cellulophaga phage phi39:1]|uniref:hypothetical protein n=1 Tax=Cellulophaga phage phi39:1 TaxID=1327993 RepID=UPI000351EE86|nr:hypothetical protein Phi39:1_gp08 [Cellulophaga phage phi39:1]AGO49123.1 hypothetical protein Phi39:1_gp08 [Cellulophaga phage phi39:1]